MSESENSLLIVDDDKPFADRLARALALRGFVPQTANSVAEALACWEQGAPAFAVFDLKLGDGSGLELMRTLKARSPQTRGLILTGYGAIASAVLAIKLGACDYLAKPVNADEVAAALRKDQTADTPESERPMSADRARWEHIQRVYETCNHNVSQTARQLSMHRRTLQRILAKRAPK